MKKLLSVFAIALIFVFTSAASASLWFEAGVFNNGAEDGSLAFWTVGSGSGATVTNLYKETSGDVTPHSGNYFFGMHGSATSESSLSDCMIYQDVPISAWSEFVADGSLLVRASAYIQTENMTADPVMGDWAELRLVFLNAADNAITYTTTMLVQSPNLQWVRYSIDSFTVPTGTETIQVQLIGQKYEGVIINAFFDDVCFEMSVIPEPATIAMLTLGGLLIGRRK
jgi:hypothetical protein